MISLSRRPKAIIGLWRTSFKTLTTPARKKPATSSHDTTVTEIQHPPTHLGGCLLLPVRVRGRDFFSSVNESACPPAAEEIFATPSSCRYSVVTDMRGVSEDEEQARGLEEAICKTRHSQITIKLLILFDKFRNFCKAFLASVLQTCGAKSLK